MRRQQGWRSEATAVKRRIPKTKVCGYKDHHMTAIGKNYQGTPRGPEWLDRAACIRVTNSKVKMMMRPVLLTVCDTAPLRSTHGEAYTQWLSSSSACLILDETPS